MDTLVEKHESGLIQTRFLPAVFYSVLRFVVLLAGYQVLSVQDQANAGIDVDSYRHGR